MKKLLLSICIAFYSLTMCAQKSEIGGFFGSAFYIGDINPTSLFSSLKPSGGIIYRYNLNARWAFKGSIIFANVEASDEKDNDGYERNLNFKSPITEIAAMAELNFFNLYNSAHSNRFTPYIFAGFAFFSFNPQAELDGRVYFLQHLGTEGQGLEGEKDFYSLTNFAIPFGIGFKVNIGKYISFGLEWGMRYTFTDYLDDVGNTYYDNQKLRELRGDVVANLADRSSFVHPHGMERGNTTTKDLYSFFGGTLTFKIGNEDKYCQLKKVVRWKGGYR